MADALLRYQPLHLDPEALQPDQRILRPVRLSHMSRSCLFSPLTELDNLPRVLVE